MLPISSHVRTHTDTKQDAHELTDASKVYTSTFSFSPSHDTWNPNYDASSSWKSKSLPYSDVQQNSNSSCSQGYDAIVVVKNERHFILLHTVTHAPKQEQQKEAEDNTEFRPETQSQETNIRCNHVTFSHTPLFLSPCCHFLSSPVPSLPPPPDIKPKLAGVQPWVHAGDNQYDRDDDGPQLDIQHVDVEPREDGTDHRSQDQGEEQVAASTVVFPYSFRVVDAAKHAGDAPH